MVQIFQNKILGPDHTSGASGKFHIAVGACHCQELSLYPTGPLIQNEITYNGQNDGTHQTTCQPAKVSSSLIISG